MVVGIGLNRDFKSRSIAIGWAVLSGSIHKGAESNRVGPVATFAVALRTIMSNCIAKENGNLLAY